MQSQCQVQRSCFGNALHKYVYVHVLEMHFINMYIYIFMKCISKTWTYTYLWSAFPKHDLWTWHWLCKFDFFIWRVLEKSSSYSPGPHTPFFVMYRSNRCNYTLSDRVKELQLHNQAKWTLWKLAWRNVIWGHSFL